ncbi:MAG: hypothetical protein A2W25_00355 [candidate division Zixibacteria bacterium RBG_16_53_22]|nr:MAG: hypothetical protein A2W25_00355 [candidate division Zixibacteria bacterium RBG_16_53_22]
MPRFLVLARGTMEARKNIGAAKESFVELSKLFRAKGATILNAYAVMGSYDYAFITDVPELGDAFELSAMIGTLGSLECETYPLMPLEELFNAI